MECSAVLYLAKSFPSFSTSGVVNLKLMMLAKKAPRLMFDVCLLISNKHIVSIILSQETFHALC